VVHCVISKYLIVTVIIYLQHLLSDAFNGLTINILTCLHYISLLHADIKLLRLKISFGVMVGVRVKTNNPLDL